jgi:hypothetical protein
MKGELLQLGMIALIMLSGVMSIIVVSYVRSVLNKIDDVGHIAPMIRNLEQVIAKVENIFITLEVTRERTSLEITQLKERIKKLERSINDISKA